MLNKTYSLRPHCVSCWTTHTLQDDTRSIQCQGEAIRLLWSKNWIYTYGLLSWISASRSCDGSGGSLPTSNHRITISMPAGHFEVYGGQVTLGQNILPSCLVFSLSFHQCSTLIFILLLLLWEGKQMKALNFLTKYYYFLYRGHTRCSIVFRWLSKTGKSWQKKTDIWTLGVL